MPATAPPARAKCDPAPVEMFQPDQMYTVQEAAQRLRYARSSLYDRMDAGDLAYTKLGGSRRLLGSDLNSWVASGRVGGGR